MLLWPEQQKALNRIKYNWDQGKHTVIIAGQRAGKTVTLCHLIDDLRGSGVDEDDVYVVGATRREAEANTKSTVYGATIIAFKTILEDMNRVTQNARNDEFIINKYKNKYVLIDEVLYLIGNIAPILISLHNVGVKIFATGSRANSGTLKMAYPFDIQYFATWDWNPTIPVSEYVEQWKKNNYKAERDFGFRDSRSTPVEIISYMAGKK